MIAKFDRVSFKQMVALLNFLQSPENEVSPKDLDPETKFVDFGLNLPGSRGPKRVVAAQLLAVKFTPQREREWVEENWRTLGNVLGGVFEVTLTIPKEVAMENRRLRIPTKFVETLHTICGG